MRPAEDMHASVNIFVNEFFFGNLFLIEVSDSGNRTLWSYYAFIIIITNFVKYSF